MEPSLPVIVLSNALPIGLQSGDLTVRGKVGVLGGGRKWGRSVGIGGHGRSWHAKKSGGSKEETLVNSSRISNICSISPVVDAIRILDIHLS